MTEPEPVVTPEPPDLAATFDEFAEKWHREAKAQREARTVSSMSNETGVPSHVLSTVRAQVWESAAAALRAATPDSSPEPPSLLGAWRRTKDFLRDRLLTSGRSDVNINAVLRVMNGAFDDETEPGSILDAWAVIERNYPVATVARLRAALAASPPPPDLSELRSALERLVALCERLARPGSDMARELRQARAALGKAPE